MKDKIDQFENLLDEISQDIEKRLKIEAITIKEYDTLISDLERDYFTVHSEEKRGDFNMVRTDLITNLISRKKDRSFFDDDIPRLKLLSDRLSKLLDTNNNLIEETRFGSRLGSPNGDFKKMLDQFSLTTETRIFGSFDHMLYEGKLTEDGYFSLILDTNKTKLFSSLSTAASFICNKPMVKGWKLWFTVDRNGKERSMEYLRKNLAK